MVSPETYASKQMAQLLGTDLSSSSPPSSTEGMLSLAELADTNDSED